MSKKEEKKQAEMPDEPMKESFHPWYTHKLSSNKEFAGYEWEIKLDSKGRQKRVMVYHGDYYYFNYKGKELKKVRRKVAILCIISLILIFATSGFVTTSSISNAIISTCELFALIPTIYEVMGLWTLCTCKEPFEMRVPMLSVRRMKSSALGIMVLIGVAGVLHIYFMFTNLGNGMLIPDLIVTIGIVTGIILQYIMRRILLTFSLEKVGGDDEDNEEKDATETEMTETSENTTSSAEKSNVSDSNATKDASTNTENANNCKQTDSDTSDSVESKPLYEGETDTRKVSTSEATEDSTPSSEILHTTDSVKESADSQAGKTADNTGNTKKKKRKNRTKKQKRTSSNSPDSVDSHPQVEGETDKNEVSASDMSENSTSSREEPVISGSESESSDCKSQDEVENT